MILAILFAKDAVVIHIMMIGMIQLKYLNHFMYLLDFITKQNIQYSIGTTLNLTEISYHFKNNIMTANTLHQLTAPNREMSSEIFEALMENLKFSRLNENEFEYRFKHHIYEIGFALINGKLDIDVFGKWHKGTEWIELEPTDIQRKAMQETLDSVEFETEHKPLPYVDEYLENGVRREDFY